MVDLALVVVTVVSLSLALVMGIITWRAVRSAAGPQREAAGGWTDGSTDRAVGRADDVEPQPAGGGGEDDAEPRGRRFVLATGLFAVMLVAILSSVYSLKAPLHRDAEMPSAIGRTDAPLELLALDHTRTGSRLAVHGVVRNPDAGTAVPALSAVVFLYDRTGGYLGTAKAAIVETALEPGQEARFAVPVPQADRVGRYRLSFRMADAPVAHVDRRTVDAPLPVRGRLAEQASLGLDPPALR
jgi:hypothetical protein